MSRGQLADFVAWRAEVCSLRFPVPRWEHASACADNVSFAFLSFLSVAKRSLILPLLSLKFKIRSYRTPDARQRRENSFVQDIRAILCGPFYEEKRFFDWTAPDDFQTLWGGLEPHLRQWYKGTDPRQHFLLKRRAKDCYGPQHHDQRWQPKYLYLHELASLASLAQKRNNL